MSTIDVQPEESCWQDSMLATASSVPGSSGGEPAFRQTTVRATWDQAVPETTTVSGSARVRVGIILVAEGDK